MKVKGREIKALFLTKYSREGASTRYRFLQYFPALKERGIECSFSPLTDAEYLKHLYSFKRGTLDDGARAIARRFAALLGIYRYDVVVIEYEILPYFPPVLEKALKLLRIPYIVNYDDAIFYRYTDSRNAVIRTLLRNKINTVMRDAKCVIAGNDYLADYARKAGSACVEVVPTVVDTAKYSAISPGKNDIFTIGWIGSPSTVKYLYDITPALAKVCDGGRGKVMLIGAGNVKLGGVPVEKRPWSEESETRDLESCDVGIMPLFDGPWERGKCGLKTIQYMACALPVVVSPVGVNKEIVENGITGFLAETNEEWARSLSALRDDKELRHRLGIAGRRKVEERYSINATVDKIASLIKEASAKK